MPIHHAFDILAVPQITIEVVIRWQSKMVQLVWRDGSGRTYNIPFTRVRTLSDIVGWMAHLTKKNWFKGALPRKLGDALIEVHNKQVV